MIEKELYRIALTDAATHARNTWVDLVKAQTELEWEKDDGTTKSQGAIQVLVKQAQLLDAEVGRLLVSFRAYQEDNKIRNPQIIGDESK